MEGPRGRGLVGVTNPRPVGHHAPSANHAFLIIPTPMRKNPSATPSPPQATTSQDGQLQSEYSVFRPMMKIENPPNSKAINPPTTTSRTDVVLLSGIYSRS